MGVSFKISKKGTRFRSKPLISDTSKFNDVSDNSSQSFRLPSITKSNGKEEEVVGLTGSSMSAGRGHSSGEEEISFILNLYPDGYSIVKASENDNPHHATFQDGLKLSRPYDRTSEVLFAAIESGRLPCGTLDDIPCKFVEGAVTCEVRDYRKCISDPRPNISSPGESATISKVSLKMSLENVVKDISLMADDSWTYGDLMEVESRILNALQPKLCLDRVPRLDRLCQNPASLKISLGLVGTRKRRLRHMPEVTVTTNNRPHGKKICIDGPPSSGYADMLSQQVQDNMSVQGSANQRTTHDPMQGHNLPPVVSPAGQEMPISYVDNMNATATAKVVSHEGQFSSYGTFNNRARLGPDGRQIPDVQWRSQTNARGVQYSQLVGEGMATQDGVKLEKADPNIMKSDTHMMDAEGNQMDPRVQQRFQHPPMRPAYHHQAGWNNLSQPIEKDLRKEEQFSKRKSSQSPRLSSGPVAQSPLSARSGDMSCGSMGGTHYGAVSSPAPLGQGLREKSGATSIQAAGRASSVTSSANDSMQHQTQVPSKRRTNSFPKNHVISGVGSPVSVNTMGGPMNVSNPSISTPHLTEQNMLERFAKIEMVAMRHQLNCKRNKVDEFPRKPHAFSARELLGCLAGVANNEYVDDSREMSKSLVGGHVNICKIRVVNLQPAMQGNLLRTRMILSEKPNDGTVAMHYGDLNDSDYLNAEDYLLTLPNTHWADMLAAQFCALVIREGYDVEEVVQPRPLRQNAPSNSQSNVSGGAPNNSTVDTHQYSEPIESKPAISNSSLTSTGNAPNPGMHPPQGHLTGTTMPARPHQMEPQQPPQQHPPHQQTPLQTQTSMMQQMPSQFQRSPLMLPNNSMPQLNAMASKSPLQMLQPPNQQTQPGNPGQMQRRMMMGLGPAMGMGNMGNMGLGGLSNVIGMGGAKGTPMGSMSGIGGNMGQNPMNLSQANAISAHLRTGTLNTHALAAQRFRVMQSRGLLQGPAAANLSMLGQSLNRGNIGLSPIQRNAMGQTPGMQKLIPGMNAPLNQQQFQHLQQMQQLQQQQQQQQPRQQHVLPQQEATSPLQAVMSPQQVSSPSTLGIPQQMNQQFTTQQQGSPQQMGQRTPMSPPLSSGPMHPMSTGGNQDGCPASPALSSQTLGSVSSITNSSMDLQGVNKSSSINNT